MKLLGLPWFRVLLTYILSLLLFWCYGSFNFYRDPGSIFYDVERAFERHYSQIRASQVHQYITEFSSSNASTPGKPTTEPKICAAFLSVKREGKQYLPVGIARLVSRSRTD
jgi:hypothetical protein